MVQNLYLVKYKNMISEVIKLLNEGRIKETEDNKILFGGFKYPESLTEAWEQFKREIWQKNTK